VRTVSDSLEELEELDCRGMGKATTGSMRTISGSVEELDSGEMGRTTIGSMGTISGSVGELDCGGIEKTTTGSILATISGSLAELDSEDIHSEAVRTDSDSWEAATAPLKASNHSYSGEAKASGIPSILQRRQIQVEK
jgi:hypothetical protein